MSDRFSLDGSVAVITGGGTGIGRGTALVPAPETLVGHDAGEVLCRLR